MGVSPSALPPRAAVTWSPICARSLITKSWSASRRRSGRNIDDQIGAVRPCRMLPSPWRPRSAFHVSRWATVERWLTPRWRLQDDAAAAPAIAAVGPPLGHIAPGESWSNRYRRLRLGLRSQRGRQTQTPCTRLGQLLHRQKKREPMRGSRHQLMVIAQPPRGGTRQPTYEANGTTWTRRPLRSNCTTPSVSANSV